MKKYAVVALFLSVFTCMRPAVASAGAAVREVPFEESGEGVASSSERVRDAQDRAEQNALSKALSRAGVDVFYGYHDMMAQGTKESQFVASAMNIFSAGVASYDKAGKPVCSTDEDGVTKCTVRIKGKITFRGSQDAGFAAAEEGLGAYYCDGDKLSLAVSSTRDAYVQILFIDESRNALLLFPAEGDTPLKLKAGEKFLFPGEGRVLAAALPEGQEESAEMLQIILTKNKPLFIPAEAKATKSAGYTFLSLGDFMAASKRLAGLERSDWTMRLLPYGIHRCKAKSQ